MRRNARHKQHSSAENDRNLPPPNKALRRWTVRRSRSALTPVDNLAIGLIALTLMVVAELLVVIELRGLSIAEYVRTRDPLSGGVYLLVLGLFALMTWGGSRRRGASMRRS
jgi:hypothetical protein